MILYASMIVTGAFGLGLLALGIRALLDARRGRGRKPARGRPTIAA